jgi:hypothetical protein
MPKWENWRTGVGGRPLGNGDGFIGGCALATEISSEGKLNLFVNCGGKAGVINVLGVPCF